MAFQFIFFEYFNLTKEMKYKQTIKHERDLMH